MSNEEEVTQLRLKVKAYEATLAKREHELSEHRTRIAHLELKLKAYEEENAIRNSVEPPTNRGFNLHNDRLQRDRVAEPQCYLEPRRSAGAEFIAYKPEAVSIRGKKRSRSPDERPIQPRQAPRWIAAGTRLIDNIVEQGKFQTEVIRLEEKSLPGLDESPLERAKLMAGRASNTLGIATNATSIAQIELAYFLSALIILEYRKTLSKDQVYEVMNLLESETRSYDRQRKVLTGRKWFHKAVIQRLLDKGWDFGHAMGAVAKSRFGSLQV
jgi:hypothetical protein